MHSTEATPARAALFTVGTGHLKKVLGPHPALGHCGGPRHFG
jgi:hypothetical protein